MHIRGLILNKNLVQIEINRDHVLLQCLVVLKYVIRFSIFITVKPGENQLKGNI